MTIFPDTNIFLHFQSVEYINWKKLAGVNESVKIMIPLVIIQEIDKHKYNSRGNIARRAQEISKKIEEWSDGSIKSDMAVFIDLSNVPQEIFTTNTLDVNNPDDRLLAAVIFYIQNNPGENIFLYTNDTGPRLKAVVLGIKTLKPNPEDQIKPEADVMEKENRELKKQVEKLKTLFPKLSLLFPDDQKYCKVKINEMEDLMDVFVEQEMREIKSKYSLMEIIDPYQNPGYFAQFKPISNTDKKAYNEKMVEFYIEYENYFRTIYQLECKKNLSTELQIRLTNEGTCPANDVDIYMHFPDGFVLEDEETYNQVPNEPSPPEQPFPYGIRPPTVNWPIHDLNRSLRLPKIPYINANMSDLKIKKTNSYNVSRWVKKLKHGHSIGIAKLYVVFASVEVGINFCIDYKITAHNLPEAVRGELHVRVVKKD